LRNDRNERSVIRRLRPILIQPLATHPFRRRCQTWSLWITSVTVYPSSHLALSPRSPTLRQTAFSLRCSSLAITLTLRCCTDSRRNLTSASLQGVDAEQRLVCKPSVRARLIIASRGNPVNL